MDNTVAVIIALIIWALMLICLLDQYEQIQELELRTHTQDNLAMVRSENLDCSLNDSKALAEL
jgi:hypothetical protein